MMPASDTGRGEFQLAAERDVTQVVQERGGRVLGSVKAPVTASDFSSFILEAQATNPDVYAFAPAGSAGVTAIKQASEFGLLKGKASLVSIFMMPDDVKALGLQVAQGLIYTTAFDPNRNDQTRAFTERFLKRAGKTPNMNMVGSYSAVMHYLEAVKAAGTKETPVVMAKMREMPVNDVFTQDGHLRIDGRMSHPMYVMQVKTPAESTNEWDLSKVIATVPASIAVRPLDAGGCPLVK